jgi:hypothetical protein
MWEPDMQCNGEAVLWSLGFGLPMASVAIGALLRGIRYLWMRKGCTMGGQGF